MAKFFDIFSGLFKGGVGNNMENNDDDVLRTKKALSSAGHYTEPVENGILDRRLDTAIKSFQSENELKVDGVMKKGGETERYLMVETVRPPIPRRRPGWENPPIVNKAATREYILMHDLPAKFEIRDNPDARKNLNIIDDIWHREGMAKKIVKENDGKITGYAKKHKVDPDLIRSVMFAENARGHKIFLNSLGDKVHKSSSPLPMNIDKNRWAGLIKKKPEDLYNPDYNIEASTVLIKRIRDRIDNPTPAKIGSLWHSSARENTDEMGEYINDVYRRKPWLKRN